MESLSDSYAPRFVLNKYEDLFWRQPNVYDVRIGQLRDNQGKMDQRGGPNHSMGHREIGPEAPCLLEDRIPESPLTIVPIRITGYKISRRRCIGEQLRLLQVRSESRKKEKKA